MYSDSIEHSTSVAIVQPLPRLGTASSRTVEKEYRSGASYKGNIHGNKRVGRGIFTWPNGAVYEGEFVDNLRHGKGVQIWADGSFYDGEFVDDMRHGRGVHKWSNEETYEGEFCLDRRHGEGTYTWPDSSSYTGTFYMDKKEGYGTFVFANSNKFEGLYKSDEREGPGVMSYPDGCQDVGLWHREKLVKLCESIPNAFTMKNHKEFDYSPEEIKMYIDPEEIQNQTEVLEGIVNPPPEFDYPLLPNITDKSKALFSDGLHSSSVAMDVKAFDSAFFKKSSTPASPSKSKNITEETRSSRVRIAKIKSEDSQNNIDSNRKKILAWNNTPSSIVIQLHIEKHKSRQDSASFSVDAIVAGNRSSFGPKGPVELASEDLLQAAILGDLHKVKTVLNGGHVHVDVADKSGHTALMGASVNWHQTIINCLLDNGADVNKLNDEGVSSLAACHIYIYPNESFKYNTAEKNLVKPSDVDQEKGFDLNEAVKSSVPQSPTATPKSKAPKTKHGKIKQIQRLREEYKTTKNAIKELESDLYKEQETKSQAKTDNLQESERKLGTLQVNRVARVNIDELMSYVDPPDNDYFIHRKKDAELLSENGDSEFETEIQDFESIKSVRNLAIGVSDQLIERCATQLSSNELVVGRSRSATSNNSTLGTVRRLAIDKSQQALMVSTVRLLLKRGADPNASNVPMPVLFFAIKAADVEAVRLLLVKGASTITTLPEKKGGLAPLHIATAIPGPEGVAITELLLNSLANPDVRAAEDDTFLNRLLEEEWIKDRIDDESRARSGGRTPLHIASARDDSYMNARDVVELLLQHHANPNLLVNGQSPLTLAIASGNDKAIDELLGYGADPNLPLTHGVGSALCQASSTEFEHRRTPPARIQLIDKLIAAGANILNPIAIGPKRVTGTAVDHAYYLYNQDRRIAHMPYHALSHSERETFNARRQLLSHLGNILRGKAVERERVRLEEEELAGRRSASPGGPTFMYIGAGAQSGIMKGRFSRATQGVDGRVSFGASPNMYSPDPDGTSEVRMWSSTFDGSPFSSRPGRRKPLFRYCYECGRSVGVRLSACTRCKEVYYCSKACKLKAWNARHKDECIRIGGRSRSSSPARNTGVGAGTGQANRIDSPTPATDPDHGKPTTVRGIMSQHGKDQRIKVPVRGRSLSARGGRRVLQPIAGGKLSSLYGGKFDKLLSTNGLALIKGLKYGSKSAGYMGSRGKNIGLEPIEPSWKDQYIGQRVWIDNYSWV